MPLLVWPPIARGFACFPPSVKLPVHTHAMARAISLCRNTISDGRQHDIKATIDVAAGLGLLHFSQLHSADEGFRALGQRCPSNYQNAELLNYQNQGFSATKLWRF